jgi:DNA mismatch endonuclease, patch repair protein
LEFFRFDCDLSSSVAKLLIPRLYDNNLMTDVLTGEQRKFNMSRIRGKNTRPELKIRRMLFSKGIRGYRIHYGMQGQPDIVFVKKKIAIFIDGCFWHKCPVCFQEPETQKEFWAKKIQSNVKRDEKVNELLKNDGWEVIRFWEHDIRKKPDKVVKKISEILGK